MKFDYNATNVTQGRANQQKAKENPTTFGTDNGADRIIQNTSLDRPQQRMAGQMGYRSMEYLNDPAERERTESWMDRFAMSNEGQQFNQAKLGAAASPGDV